jgi:urea carboxylase
LVEFGQMHLDLVIRARIHAIELVIKQKNPPGLRLLRPCTRSTMVRRSFFVLSDVELSPVQCDYDFNIISQAEILDILVAAQKAVPDDVTGMSFPARRITFPVVLDDRWNREASVRYMATVRKKAVYLPSNIDYLARNNGLSSGTEMLEKMVASDWVR